MKAILLLSIALGIQIKATVYSQTTMLNLDIKDVTIREALNKLEESSKFKFFYNEDFINVDRQVSLKVSNNRIDEILNKILQETDIGYKILENNMIVLTKKKNEATQKLTIKGKVTDSEGIALPGVNVIEKETGNGTTTDQDGNYSISVSNAGSMLIFSFIGYLTEEIIVGGETTHNIILLEDILSLQEVVVVGYGTQKKKDVTGAIKTVNQENFNNGVVISPEQLLQGKVSGVNITSSSGEPGAAQTITIRGPGSIRSGNTPLFVVDGVPLSNDVTTSGAVDMGFGGQSSKNPLNFINPNDINSIDVLKDASAAAIYGSRGSNGVIIITTKSGKKGKSSVDFSSEFGISKIARKIEMLSAEEFTAFHEENGTNQYIGDTITDWQDEIYRQGISQNHKLSLSNATENTNYFASLSYFDQEGIIKGSSLKRYTGRINAGQDMINHRLKVNLNLTASHIRDDAVPIGDNPSASGDLITSALTMNPTYPVKNEDGSYFEQVGSFNPLTLLEIYKDFSTTNRILGNLDASLEIIKGLTYKINLGMDGNYSTRNMQICQHTYSSINASPEGRLYVSNIESYNHLVDNILTYNREFNNQAISLMAGHSYQNFFFRYHGYGVSEFSTDEIDAIYNPSIGASVERATGDWPSGWARKDELQSFFGRLNYSLANKYLLTATLRYDGSSRFGKNNKYGTFPSISGAWRIGEEDFLSGWDVLYNLKLRVGWGQTGNQEVPSKQTLASVVTNSEGGTGYALNHDDISPGIRFVRNSNPDLKWEVVTQTNIGLDFGLLDGRIFGSADYFNKVTTDALLEVTIEDPMESAGGSTMWKNLEDTKIINKGWEFELGYQSSVGNLKYSISANASILNNIINNLQSIYHSGVLHGPGMTNDKVIAYIDGESVGSFYIPEFLGFDSIGRSTYYGAGDTIKLGNSVTTEDYIIAGSALPDFTYNFSGNIEYKGFELSFNFNGVSGNYVYNNTANAYFRRALLAGGNNVEKKLLDEYPDESNTNVDKPSTRYLEKGNFLRLNNLTFGYNWNLSKTNYIKYIRFSITGQNLFVLTDYTGYDPEVNTNKNVAGRTSYGIDMSSYPKAKTILFGVNVTF